MHAAQSPALHIHLGNAVLHALHHRRFERVARLHSLICMNLQSRSRFTASNRTLKPGVLHVVGRSLLFLQHTACFVDGVYLASIYTDKLGSIYCNMRNCHTECIQLDFAQIGDSCKPEVTSLMGTLSKFDIPTSSCRGSSIPLPALCGQRSQTRSIGSKTSSTRSLSLNNSRARTRTASPCITPARAGKRRRNC